MNQRASIPIQAQSRQSQNRQPTTSTAPGQTPSLEPTHLAPDTLLMLQRTVGNQAVLRLLRGEPATGASPSRLPSAGAIMPKLQVGPVNDKYEQEADRIATQVLRKPAPVQRHHNEEEEKIQTKRAEPVRVSSIQRAAESHGPGCGCGSCVQRSATAQVQRAAHSRNCNCPQCAQVQRHAPQVKKDGSFEADQNLTDRVRRLEGRGRPLDDTIRREMESRFGADFSGVRIHTDAAANRLNRDMRADAFTYRQHIAFAAGRYNPGSDAGKRLLAHELTHTLQQTGGVQTSGVQRHQERHQPGCKCESCAGVQHKASRHARQPVQRRPAVHTTRPTTDVVQRHSSWEHKLIGDLTPQDLAIVGASRDAKEAADEYGEQVTVNAAGKMVSKETVLHVLEQEIQRLRYFQKNPLIPGDLKDLQREEDVLKQRDQRDRIKKATTVQEAQAAANTQWQVKLVGIPAKDGRMFGVTYGELNTLADFYGSVHEMKNADPNFLERLIRGVRESTLEQLIGLYAEVKGVKEKKARKELGIKSTAFGKKAIPLGGVMNELKLMGMGPIGTKKKGIAGDASTGYKETLARNACHFPPESWHAWALHHEKARQLAKASLQERIAGNGDRADELYNKALLYNGFGDHYLQDSYASGHLINKTQIMQWYVEWLDQNPWYWDAYRDKNWRGMQQMAYNQPGLADPDQYKKESVDKAASNPHRREARNPQSVANKGGTWQDQFKELGLEAPKALTPGSDANRLLVWWQKDTMTKSAIRRPREKKLSTLRANGPLGASTDAALFELVSQGIVRPAKYSTSYMQTIKQAGALNASPSDVFVLREDYIPKNIKTTGELDQKITNKGGTDYTKMGEAVVYEDYRAFMRSSFLQKATNSLHDYYCQKGLNVYAGDSTQVFKIYGDNNMLQKGSAKGLLHSGQTARMSQQAIESIATTGSDQGITTAKIVERFPEGVELTPGGQRVSLEDWHNGGTLKNLCFKKVFPEMSKAGMSQIKNKLAPGVLGRSLGNVTPIKPHGNEAF